MLAFGLSMGLYILAMTFVWGFFLVAKINFFKYREYSRYIYPVTKLLMIILSILTILGFIFIYNSIESKPATETIQESANNDVF